MLIFCKVYIIQTWISFGLHGLFFNKIASITLFTEELKSSYCDFLELFLLAMNITPVFKLVELYEENWQWIFEVREKHRQ